MARSLFNLKTLAIAIMAVFAIPVFAAEYRIYNPYENVDFSKQYKAGFHNHSTYSDGSNTRKDMLEDAYRKDYSVFTMNDHNWLTPAWDEPGYGPPDRGTFYGGTSTNKVSLTTQEKDNMNAGTYTGVTGRTSDIGGMIGLVNTNEHSSGHHINSYLADYATISQDVDEILGNIRDKGGISIINHPGRHTNGAGQNCTSPIASNDATNIQKYADYFRNYPSSVGMEIINKTDGESRTDRFLWDNLLKEMMPDRPVWGFSNDDSHSLDETGYSYNLLLMPELSDEKVLNSMQKGAFFAFSRAARCEGIWTDAPNRGSASHISRQKEPMPKITNIEVNDNTITITAITVNSSGVEIVGNPNIDWIADGIKIHTGSSLNIANFSDKINNYVRANVWNSNGIIFVQPFGIKITRTIEEEIVAAKTAIESRTYNVEFANGTVINAVNVKRAIEQEIAALQLVKVNTKVEVTEVGGSYTFTVELSKEPAQSQTTLSMPINVSVSPLTCELTNPITKIVVSSGTISRSGTWTVKCNNTTTLSASSSGFAWETQSSPSAPATSGLFSYKVTGNSGAGACAGKNATCTVPVVPAAFECTLKDPGAKGKVGEPITLSNDFNVYCHAYNSSNYTTNSTVVANNDYTISTINLTPTVPGLFEIDIRKSGGTGCSNATAKCVIEIEDTRTEEQKCADYWTGVACVPVVSSCALLTDIIIANECVARTETQCTGAGIEWHKGTCMTNADVLLAKKETCDEYWTGAACVAWNSTCAETEKVDESDNSCMMLNEAECGSEDGVEWHAGECMTLAMKNEKIACADNFKKWGTASCLEECLDGYTNVEGFCVDDAVIARDKAVAACNLLNKNIQDIEIGNACTTCKLATDVVDANGICVFNTATCVAANGQKPNATNDDCMAMTGQERCEYANSTLIFVGATFVDVSTSCKTSLEIEQAACTEYWNGMACVPVVTSCTLATQTVVANECVARTEAQCAGTGIEWYNGACTTTIPIIANLSSATVTVNGTYTYNGMAQIPAAENVVVVFNDKILEHDVDYIYAVANNINAGMSTVTLTGKGYYTGTKTEDFTILPTPLTTAIVSEFNPMIYTGIEQTPNATVTVNGLTATGTWSDVVNVADLTAFTANGNFTGTLERATGMAKADGETVAKPVLASRTSSSITIEALTTSNDQEVEYAISENEFPKPIIFGDILGILDILEFSGLKESSTYYIFARAKENANYKTGNISEPLETSTQTNSSSSNEEAYSSSDGESSSSSDDGQLPIHFSQAYMGNISAKAIGRAIVLENVPQGAKVRIYNLKGERIYNSQLSAFNSQLKIEVQTRGMYVAKIGSQTLRVLVK
ncbi:MAG: hypothetical protein FWB90_08715 [Fibromonadales bacterium]|nr:hypothetical protein [Fibromonadales bacterium]